VKRTIERILGEFPPADKKLPGTSAIKGNILRSDEIYYPCLALILLAEVNDKKYENEIKRLINMLIERQHSDGAFGYLRDPTAGDTSQSQFVALALYVAKQHGFSYSPRVPGAILQWLVATQQPKGNFVYTLRNRKSTRGPDSSTLSIHTAGVGSVYLLSDLLQLQKRKKPMTTQGEEGLDLPRTVSIYIPPKKKGGDQLQNREGPLLNFPIAPLIRAERGGNLWLDPRFKIPSNGWKWNFYYLYALERYAWFREQTDGDMGNGRLRRWYDQGVDFLRSAQANKYRLPSNNSPLKSVRIP